MNAPASGGWRAAQPVQREALRAFDGELTRLDRLIEREILRLRARYELSLDEFRGLYISDRQVDELLGARNNAEPSAVAQAAAEVAPGPGAPAATPWSQIARALGLSRAERDILLAALAPEIDPKYETLFAYLNNDVTRKWPTPELIGRLFCATPQDRVALRAQLVPDALLTSVGLIETIAGSAALPRAQRGVRVAGPVADWLLGMPYSDERLTGVAQFVAPERPAGWLPGGMRRQLSQAARWVASGRPMPVLVCTAPERAEAAAAARQIFAFAAKPALLIDLHALKRAAAEDFVAALRTLCAVFHTGVVAGPLDALFDADGRLAESGLLLGRLAQIVPALVLSGSPQAARRALHEIEPLRRRAFELRLAELTTLERAAVWKNVLGEGAGDADIDGLADRFVLGAERIARAVDLAADTAEFHAASAPIGPQLYDAARAVSVEGGDAAVRTVDTPFDWDDLVVPPKVSGHLRDVLRAVELRPRVLDQWGFARRMSGARGVKVMFSGASGTGKTMAAAILAKSLALDLHRVELAAVVSKYIGETEKNLDRAFDAARRANAILFIDEADALFGKRSEVKDAHDRYANLETAYLLQKMEDHDGVVILATNLANNIDEAFSRRMHYVIEFPMPDIAAREKLWRGMFPAGAPRADDIDFVFLARQFALAGGDIRNIVLDAAYRAAQTDQPIGMRHVLQALVQQYAKRGKMPTASEFREYFGLLADAPDATRTA